MPCVSVMKDATAGLKPMRVKAVRRATSSAMVVVARCRVVSWKLSYRNASKEAGPTVGKRLSQAQASVAD